jgi:hypothetical protein
VCAVWSHRIMRCTHVSAALSVVTLHHEVHSRECCAICGHAASWGALTRVLHYLWSHRIMRCTHTSARQWSRKGQQLNQHLGRRGPCPALWVCVCECVYGGYIGRGQAPCPAPLVLPPLSCPPCPAPLSCPTNWRLRPNHTLEVIRHYLRCCL